MTPSTPAAGAACTFCAIVDGQLPASVVAETDTVLAFLDINQLPAPHVLVVPRAHAQALDEVDPAVAGDLMRLAQRVARVARGDGVNLLLADGKAAGQEVPHVHLHVIGRTWGDGGPRFGARWRRTGRGPLEELAKRLRQALAES